MFGRVITVPDDLTEPELSVTATARWSRGRVPHGVARPLPSVRRHARPGGINFAVFSRHAQRSLSSCSATGTRNPSPRFPLDPATNKTGDVWHVFVRGLTPLLYGYRVDGPFAPKAGHRFNPRPSCSTPTPPPSAAATLGKPRRAAWHGNGRLTRRGRLAVDEFDWEDDVPPATPLAQTVLYELHVRGYTRHPVLRRRAIPAPSSASARRSRT